MENEVEEKDKEKSRNIIKRIKKGKRRSKRGNK